MKKAIDFLKTHWDVALATVGQDKKPKVRAFQIMRVDDYTLYFATSKEKEVYTQLQSNKNMEILAMDGTISVRASGVAEFNVSNKDAESIYYENTILQGLYKDFRDVIFFSMEIDDIEYYDMAVNPPLAEGWKEGHPY